MNSSLYNQYTSNEMLTATVTATIDGNKIDIFTKNYSGQPNRRKGYWISAMPNKVPFLKCTFKLYENFFFLILFSIELHSQCH